MTLVLLTPYYIPFHLIFNIQYFITACLLSTNIPFTTTFYFEPFQQQQSFSAQYSGPQNHFLPQLQQRCSETSFLMEDGPPEGTCRATAWSRNYGSPLSCLSSLKNILVSPTGNQLMLRIVFKRCYGRLGTSKGRAVFSHPETSSWPFLYSSTVLRAEGPHARNVVKRDRGKKRIRQAANTRLCRGK